MGHKKGEGYWLGKKRSEEDCLKMSEAQKKNPQRYWLGKKVTPEMKEASSKTQFKKGIVPWNKGIKNPDMSKEKHPRWKGGISKSKEYIAHYKRVRKMRQKNAIGAHTFYEWINVKESYKNTCPCCLLSEPNIKLTVDHIIPISKGGTNYISNIQPLCGSCNSKKSAKTIKYENPFKDIAA